jgi:hypothetical protein
MRGRTSIWSLQSVMIVTIHVAVVAYVIRVLAQPKSWVDTIFVAVPVIIGVALFLSWPISRVLASAFDPGDASVDRRCPKCGRRELRPLLRNSGGIFQPVTGYRCAGCWTTYRQVGELRLAEPPLQSNEPVDSKGIEFLDQGVSEDEFRFLDS